MKLKSILAASAVGAVMFVGAASPSFATQLDPECVPSDAVAAYDDPDVITPQPDTFIEHEAVAAVTERVNYNWTGGPTESAPAIDADGWHANSGEHNGKPFDQPDNVPFRVGNGNGDWFLWRTVVVTEGTDAWTETVHHDPIVTPGAHHDAVEAVTCEQDEVVSEWHTWVAPEWVEGLNGHGSANDIGWPQAYVGAGQIAPEGCELTYQQDLYVGTRSEIDAVIDDQVLDGLPPEDSAIVEDWTFISTDECPTPVTYTPVCTTVQGSFALTDESFDGDVLTLNVSGDWDSETFALPIPDGATLADIGSALDIDASPIQYVGLHIHTALGTIVYEEEPSYGGNLWSNVAWAGVDAGMGYPAFGSIEQFINLNGNVPVTGIDILYTSPDASSTEVTSVTIDCTTFTFADEEVVVEEPPTEEPPVVTPPVVTPPVVTPPVVEVITPVVTPSPTVTPQGNLASTGSDGSGVLALIGLGLVGAGAITLIARRKASA